MTGIGSLSNTMRTVLLAAVLIPGPLLAEPADTARQMLTQAQTRAQDQVKSEVKKIMARGPILTETPAATSFSTNLREPGAVSPVSASATEARIDLPSEPTLTALRDDSFSVLPTTTTEPPLAARAPAYQVASIARLETSQSLVDAAASIVTSPAPATAADTAQVAAPVAATMAVAATSHDTPIIAPTPMAQPTIIETPLAKPEAQATAGSTFPPKTEARSETGRNFASESKVAVQPAAKKTTAPTRVANTSAAPHQRRAVELADRDIRTQLKRLTNRPDVRALMAQYGLN
jgi:hypothetical protein